MDELPAELGTGRVAAFDLFQRTLRRKSLTDVQSIYTGFFTHSALNESARLKLLKDKCFEGTSSFGAYYLYAVEHDGMEKAFFATPGLHNTIVEAKLKTGDEFILRKTAVQNGKKLTPQISIEFVEQPQVVSPTAAPPSSPTDGSSDGLKEILLQCVKDAAEVIRDSGIQMGNDELQKLATTLFIQRAKAA